MGVFTIDWREALFLRLFRLVRLLRLDRMVRYHGRSFQFTYYFRGFERVGAVRRIFGDETDKVLDGLKVDFIAMVGYMGVNNSNGHLIVNPRYLKEGDRLDLYLDVVHELVHVRQFMEGKELFESRYDYVDRPTEVEAYRFTVEEARRLGVGDERICLYLKTPWMSSEDLRRLAKTLNVHCP
jgi:hypothetical protein